MANINHIIVTLVVSILLLASIGLWVGHRNGEVSLLGDSGGSKATADTALPGPLTAPDQQATGDAATLQNTDNTQGEPMTNESTQNPTAIFHTNKGDISIELYQDKMPITVDNFVKLAQDNFYDGSKFHRVIAGFMIQGGDPNSKGTNTAVYGQGGPGYTIQDEFVADPRLTNTRGSIAMANTGQPNSGGSQFFINLVDNTGLDYDKPPQGSSHPVFGRVTQGLDIVDTIGATPTGDRDLPIDPVVINDIEIK